MDSTGEKVELQIYDISNGMASQLSPILLGRTIEAIYHTGVLIYGYEYFYGGGIVCVRPEEITRLYGMKPIRTLNLGITKKTQKELNQHLESISRQFSSDNYDLLNHNCNHFSDNVVRFLLGEGIPSYILELPNEVMKTPFGSMILPMLQKVQKSQAIRSVANVWNTNGISPSSVINKTAGEINNLNNYSNSSSQLDPKINSTLCKKIEMVTKKYGWQSQKVLETLETILYNILRNPGDLRYRSIKSTSNTLKNVLMGIDEGLDLLFTLGFREKNIDGQIRYEIQLNQPINKEEKDNIESQLNIIKYYLGNIRISDNQDQQVTGQDTSMDITNDVESSSNLKNGSSKESIDYIKLLNEIKSMGFEDNQKILHALHRAKGDLALAISMLLDQQNE